MIQPGDRVTIASASGSASGRVVELRHVDETLPAPLDTRLMRAILREQGVDLVMWIEHGRDRQTLIAVRRWELEWCDLAGMPLTIEPADPPANVCQRRNDR